MMPSTLNPDARAAHLALFEVFCAEQVNRIRRGELRYIPTHANTASPRPITTIWTTSTPQNQ